jgi:ParB/RepB/Spo0J family partition protein
MSLPGYARRSASDNLLDYERRGGYELIRRQEVHLHPAWLVERPSPTLLKDLTEQVRYFRKIQEPIHVWRRRSSGNTYFVLTGRRHYFAAAAARLPSIPIVYRRVATDEEAEREFLLDCLRWDQLSPIGKASAHDRLVALGLQPKHYAQRAGTSPSMVTNQRHLLALPDDVQWLIRGGALAYKHGRALHDEFLPWPRMVVRLALATVANAWTTRELDKHRPAHYGLIAGQPEPAEWPDPGRPPFGPAWRPPRVRDFLIQELGRWVREGTLTGWDLAATAAQIVADAGTASALEAVGWIDNTLDEQALALGPEVEAELDCRPDGRTDQEARTEAVRTVWTRWFHALAAHDPLLVWTIATETWNRWHPTTPPTVWLPPSQSAPAPSAGGRA